jgi:hypothetical protein
MLINNVNIETLFPDKIQFLSYSPATPSWNRFISVMDTDFKIVNDRGSVGITNWQVRVAFFDTKDASYRMASKIVSLLNDALVSFDTNGLTYRVQVATNGQFTLHTDVLHEYQFELQVLEVMSSSVVSVNGAAGTAALNNTGTYKTPIIITLTPASDLASITLTGFLGHETTAVTITGNHTNRRIVINGEKRLILEETGIGSNVYANKFTDSDILYFPEITTGVTNLTYTPTTGMAVNVTFYPRYI